MNCTSEVTQHEQIATKTSIATYDFSHPKSKPISADEGPSDIGELARHPRANDLDEVRTLDALWNTPIAGELLDNYVDSGHRKHMLRVVIDGVEARRLSTTGDEGLQGDALSCRIVLEHAAARYFELVEVALGSLNGYFSLSELNFILNLLCEPVWHRSTGWCLAVDVMEEYGIDDPSSLDPSSELAVLVNKLSAIGLNESLALVDMCERYWRGQYDQNANSQLEIFQSLGIEPE